MKRINTASVVNSVMGGGLRKKNLKKDNTNIFTKRKYSDLFEETVSEKFNRGVKQKKSDRNLEEEYNQKGGNYRRRRGGARGSADSGNIGPLPGAFDPGDQEQPPPPELTDYLVGTTVGARRGKSVGVVNDELNLQENVTVKLVDVYERYNGFQEVNVLDSSGFEKGGKLEFDFVPGGLPRYDNSFVNFSLTLKAGAAKEGHMVLLKPGHFLNLFKEAIVFAGTNSVPIGKKEDFAEFIQVRLMTGNLCSHLENEEVWKEWMIEHGLMTKSGKIALTPYFANIKSALNGDGCAVTEYMMDQNNWIVFDENGNCEVEFRVRLPFFSSIFQNKMKRHTRFKLSLTTQGFEHCGWWMGKQQPTESVVRAAGVAGHRLFSGQVNLPGTKYGDALQFPLGDAFSLTAVEYEFKRGRCIMYIEMVTLDSNYEATRDFLTENVGLVLRVDEVYQEIKDIPKGEFVWRESFCGESTSDTSEILMGVRRKPGVQIGIQPEYGGIGVSDLGEGRIKGSFQKETVPRPGLMDFDLHVLDHIEIDCDRLTDNHFDTRRELMDDDGVKHNVRRFFQGVVGSKKGGHPFAGQPGWLEQDVGKESAAPRAMTALTDTAPYLPQLIQPGKYGNSSLPTLKTWGKGAFMNNKYTGQYSANFIGTDQMMHSHTHGMICLDPGPKGGNRSRYEKYDTPVGPTVRVRCYMKNNAWSHVGWAPLPDNVENSVDPKQKFTDLFKTSETDNVYNLQFVVYRIEKKLYYLDGEGQMMPLDKNVFDLLASRASD